MAYFLLVIVAFIVSFWTKAMMNARTDIQLQLLSSYVLTDISNHVITYISEYVKNGSLILERQTSLLLRLVAVEFTCLVSLNYVTTYDNCPL